MSAHCSANYKTGEHCETCPLCCYCGTPNEAREVASVWTRLVDLLFVVARCAEAQAAREAERSSVAWFLRGGASEWAKGELDSDHLVANNLKFAAEDIEAGMHVAGLGELETDGGSNGNS